MTSLELFRNSDPRLGQPDPPEWGTGKQHEKTKVNLWAPKTPSWHYNGEPIEQYYTLTKLKLSNVRLNDQLLPRPQDCDMGKIMIQKPFPAEHPYASHMSRFSMFPKFDTPEDAKRGSDARSQMPKNAEMPSQPYDITIIRKVKGNAFRHEHQALPSESEKKPLHWHDGDKFDQLVKSPWGGQQAYYPTPPKTFVPNLDQRSDGKVYNGNMQIAPDTANATRNVEREQWQTTYDRAHTGLGPTNPMSLDNQAEKEHRKHVEGTGKSEDDLHPREIRTFDPARPMEGRIARALVPPPPPQTDRWPNPDPDPNYQRKPTLTEKEEDRLLNGQEYDSLPARQANSAEGDLQWRTLDDQSHPKVGLATMEGALAKNPSGPDPVPFVPAGAPSAQTGTYLDGLLQEQHDKHQQIEATNRWKVLEAQTPSHNITARQHKMNMSVDKSQPATFYRHEGKYQRERAGLYKTSYDPYELQYSMNKEQLAGSELFYTKDSHKDALNLPHKLNEDIPELLREGRTLGGAPGSVPQLHPQAAPHEMVGPYDRLKALQKAQLQPNLETADVRTQEGGTVLVETSYGDCFNTPKFLQENELPFTSRKEPNVLISKDNQDLGKSRLAAIPKGLSRSVQFNSDVTVASGAGGEPIRLASAPLANPKHERPLQALRPESSPHVPVFTRRTATDGGVGKIPAANAGPGERANTNLYASLPVPIELNGRLGGASGRWGGPETSETKAGSAPRRSLNAAAAGGSFSDLFPGTNHVDMTYKNDKRFDWKAGCGTPRPQSNLIELQDSFTKSDARRRFHDKFPERNPDLRENIIAGKKHTFVGGLNAQVLRGTPLVS